MRCKNLVEKAFTVLLLIVLILCLFACSKDKNDPDLTSSTYKKENPEIVFETRDPLATTKQGRCGDFATWVYDVSKKQLDIYGEGVISDSSEWEGFASDIVSIIIDEGITDFDFNVFNKCVNTENFDFPSTINRDKVQKFEKSEYYLNRAKWTDGLLYQDGVLVEVNTNVSGVVKVKEGTTAITRMAFLYCSEITSVIIPDSVESIGDFAFGQCTSLESVTIGNGVKDIAYNLFDDPYAGCENIICESLKEISVDNQNPYFMSENGILYNKDQSELIKIPTLCNLKSYILPYKVTLIRPSAFNNCKYLESIIINNLDIVSLEGIGFGGCNNLKTVVLPDNLLNLGDQTFKFSGIESIVIPDKVTRIGQETFAYCNNLKTITLGSGISEIDGLAFASSYAIEQINVASGNSTFSSEDGVLFNKNKTDLIVYPYAKNSEQYNIPESVKNIAGGAFDCSKNLKKLFVGKNVERIASGNTFYGKIVDADYGLGDPCEYYTYDIYYEGSQPQWAQINSLNENFDEIESTVHFNSSRPLETTAPTKKSNLFDWF